MKGVGIRPQVIRAGKANLFMSDLFIESFVNSTGVPVELYQSDGSIGAAIGAGIGCKAFSSANDAFAKTKPLKVIEPSRQSEYDHIYSDWKDLLIRNLN